MQSIESDALEPTRSELKHLSLGAKLIRLAPVYGLVILTLGLILLFSILLPNTFPTLLNLRAIISDKAIIALLSLAAMIPMVAGRIDLTVGYGIVLWHILAISLQTMFGIPWPVAVMIVLLLGAFVGLLNGLLVEVAKIDAFIATLGTGTVLYALALWQHWRPPGGRCPAGRILCHQRHVPVRPSDHWLLRARHNHHHVAGARVHANRPLSLLHWGQPPRRRAERHSDPQIRHGRVRHVRPADGTCRGHSRLEIAHRPGQCRSWNTCCPHWSAPSSARRPSSRDGVNVWGTIVGVAILAVGISGIQQIGGSFWVEPMFNGVTLLVAIGIAGYAQRRKGAAKK